LGARKINLVNFHSGSKTRHPAAWRGTPASWENYEWKRRRSPAKIEAHSFGDLHGNGGVDRAFACPDRPAHPFHQPAIVEYRQRYGGRWLSL